jgi:hypothetical protein
LDEARRNAANRILSDPNAARSNPDFMIRQLERIAAGEKPDDDNGIGGILGDVVGKTLGGIGYVLGRPLAVVASAGKEISDIASGQASFEDFFKQAIAKDTTVSKYLPKTGTKWLDSVIGFAADIALDPLTYVGFGASKWAGRQGRLDLAAFAAKEENLLKAPSLLKKVEDGSIARLGEWALDAAEREALGIQRGVHFAFGKGNVIGKPGTFLGKVSEGAATAVGKPLAKTRAALGDSGLFTPLQKLTAKEYEKVAGLTTYGRRAKDSVDVVERLTQLGAYDSIVKANANGRLVGAKLGATASKLANDVAEHEQRTGNRIFDVLEGMREPVDAAEAALAQRARQFFDEGANAGNEATSRFGLKRNTRPFLIDRRQGYVPHVYSQEFKDYLASKDFKKNKWASSLKRALGVGTEEFVDGPGVIQQRKLLTGRRFLGQVLETNTGDGLASMAEINRISREAIGINIFEEDAAKYINSYANSIATQVKRVTFADNLFDYGADVVRTITGRVMDDPDQVKQFYKTLDSYDNLVTPILDGAARTTQGVLGPRLALAQAVASSEPGAKILTTSQVGGVRRILRQTFGYLAETDKLMATADDATREAYDAMATPLRARLDAIENALVTGDEVQLVYDLGLTPLYKRMFPGAEVPLDPKAMAEDIVDAIDDVIPSSTIQPRGETLENIVAGAEQNLSGRPGNAVNRLRAELADLKANKPRATRQIANKEQELADATSRLGVDEAIGVSKEEWDRTVGSVYSNDVQRVIDDVTANPPSGPAGQSTADWVNKTVKTLEGLNAPGLALSQTEREVLTKVVTQLKGMEAQVALLDAQRAISPELIESAMRQETIAGAADTILKGWENIESLGIALPPEVRDVMFGRVGELKTAAGANQFLKMYRAYNKFFKVSAMLSPGFVARNGYTAAFNNFVFGSNPKEVVDGLRFATNVMRLGIDGALERLPANLRGTYEEALRMAYATGAGQTADDILGPIISGKGKKILQGKIVGTWSKANESMELGARVTMGLTALRKGMNFEEGVGNIARYHFDYTNLSTLDRAMLNFIPFWTFASRNVGLQIINQVARPSRYRMFESAQRNFPAEDQENMPAWLRERNPMRLPGMPSGTIFNLDMPQLDMEDQIRMLRDPRRLLSQANPLVKLPIELYGGTQLWSNVPFSEKVSPVKGPLDFPAYAAGVLFGDAGKMPASGQYYTNAKAAYAVPNLIPTLAQLQRLLPQLGGKDAYQDRQGSSVASFFGLPYRRVSENERFNELQRRQFAIKDYLSNLTRTGYLEKKNGGQ